MRYVVPIDGEAGAHGVTIPDLPGCTAMGEAVEAALAAAVEAMRDWADGLEEDGGTVPVACTVGALRADPGVTAALADGAMLASVALVRVTGRPVTANLSPDSGVLDVLDAEAKRNGPTRSGMVEAMTKRLAGGNL